MKVKKLCKKIVNNEIINVYDHGCFVDQGGKKKISNLYGDRKVDNVWTWYISEQVKIDAKEFTPVLCITLK